MEQRKSHALVTPLENSAKVILGIDDKINLEINIVIVIFFFSIEIYC